MGLSGSWLVRHHCDLTGMMVNVWGSERQMTLFQVRELLQFTENNEKHGG